MPTLEVNGTTLRYEDDGPRDAPTVVLSHSLYFDRRMFAGQVAGLAERFRVVGYDHRGQGASARAPLERLDMDTLTDDAAALIEALGIAPCVFLGNSMGGFVALRLAARRPDLVRAVVAAGSSAAAELEVDRYTDMLAAFAAGGVGDELDTVMSNMLGATILADADRAPLVQSWRERIGALGPEIHGPAWQVVHRRPILDELAAAPVPVVALAGAEDRAFGIPLSRQIAETAPHGRLVVQEHAGHCVALETPEPVNALLEELLAAPAP